MWGTQGWIQGSVSLASRLYVARLGREIWIVLCCQWKLFSAVGKLQWAAGLVDAQRLVTGRVELSLWFRASGSHKAISSKATRESLLQKARLRNKNTHSKESGY